MKPTTLLTYALLFFGIITTNAQLITTFAGNGTAGFSGNGGQATAAELNVPDGAACDASGNIYIADGSNNRVRKVTPSGIISTYAGNGTAGYTGDGGQATAAEINIPHGMTADASGNLYFVDQNNNSVRKVNSSGIISTFAGNGHAGFSGDGGQATAAEFDLPTEVVFDASGNAYITDKTNERIRKVNTSGIISTFAGNGHAGYSGDGGQATAAEFNGPTDIYIDASGNAYVADPGNFRVRKINTSGIISTVIGDGHSGFSGDGGQATAAEIEANGVRVDASGNIYIGDFGNNRMRKVNTSGVINTIAGNGTAGYSGDGGQATAAELNGPGMMTFDKSGNVYFTDHSNNVIRELYLTLNVTTSVTANETCNGGSTGSASSTPSNGTTPYTYSWSPGSNTNQNPTGLTAGTYTVTVTDNDGVTGSASVSITQPSALGVSASASTYTVCPGSSDVLSSTASGGTSPYTYAWTPAPFGDLTCPTCATTTAYPFGTTYTMTVTDNCGATATASVNITVYPIPYVTISGPLNPIAAGRSDTLVANVFGTATYLWSNSATTSSIIVSPSVSTTYFLTTTNTYGCYDTAHYTIDTNTIGTGISSSSPIRIVPSSYVNPVSFSSIDSVVWFSFVPTDSNNQIIANSAFLGYPVPHVHRLTLYNPSKHILVDEPMPDITGANQIRIDISHLKIDSTYYIRAARTPAHANMAGCNPTGDECNASQRWDFQMAFRTVPVFVPKDSGSELPATNQLYYECRGQIRDLNNIPRFDIKTYTNFTSPAVYCSDSAVSFVYKHTDTAASFIDSAQRVDMVLTGTYIQPSQPVYKMEEDSGAGYLNYFLGFVPNGVTKVEGYSRMVYKNVYPNLDMHVYSNGSGTKLYFVCNPISGTISAGNPANIELKFKGANSVTVNSDSGITISTELGNISFAPGYAYMDSAGIIVSKSWHANFEIVSSNVVRFHTGVYNTSEPLIIQVDRGHPVTPNGTGNIRWCTYVGSTHAGETNNSGFYDVYSWNESAMAAGYCAEAYFPVTAGVVDGTYKGGYAGLDAAIVKFNEPSGSLNWATYWGGSDDDIAYSVIGDGNGDNVYVTGYTRSTDLPIVQPAGSYNQQYLNKRSSQYTNTDADAFILYLNSAGTGVSWSTWFGGDNGGTGAGEVGYHLALDYSNGLSPTNLYVVGGQLAYETNSQVPIQPEGGAYNNSTSGMAWIAKFSIAAFYGNGSYAPGQWLWSTRIGSNSSNPASDQLFGCCIDNGNNLWVCGQVSQSGFDIVNDSHGGNSTYSGYQGNFEGIVAKIDGSTNNIDFSTYYGGDGDEFIKSITTDGSNVYMTGSTTSPYAYNHTSIPLVNPNQGYDDYSGTNNAGTGGQTAFIGEFTNSGTLVWSTYFGGTDAMQGNGIAYDKMGCNDIYITGSVSGDLPVPVVNPAGTYTNTTSTAGGFIAAFSTSYISYGWGTYFGGTDGNSTTPNAVACDNAGNYNNIVIAGGTGSYNIPVYDAFQSVDYGGTDAFVADFDPTAICKVLGIDNISTQIDSISVYPNPTLHNITVEMELIENEKVEFVLYNLMGETVMDNTISGEKGPLTHEIDLSLLPNGIYLLKVNDGTGFYTKKVIKQD